MLHALLSRITYVIIGAPLYAIFRHGPSAIGCWQGKSDAEVCGALTNTEESFWKTNAEECATIIDKKFTSFYVLASALGYSYVMFNLITIGFRVLVIRWVSRPTLSIDRDTVRMLK